MKSCQEREREREWSNSTKCSAEYDRGEERERTDSLIGIVFTDAHRMQIATAAGWWIQSQCQKDAFRPQTIPTVDSLFFPSFFFRALCVFNLGSHISRRHGWIESPGRISEQRSITFIRNKRGKIEREEDDQEPGTTTTPPNVANWIFFFFGNFHLTKKRREARSHYLGLFSILPTLPFRPNSPPSTSTIRLSSRSSTTGIPRHQFLPSRLPSCFQPIRQRL